MIQVQAIAELVKQPSVSSVGELRKKKIGFFSLFVVVTIFSLGEALVSTQLVKFLAGAIAYRRRVCACQKRNQ
jgi:hypothetical protein